MNDKKKYNKKKLNTGVSIPKLEVHGLGVLIPVKAWNWRYGCHPKGNGDDGFAWSYTRGMTSGDERLRMRWATIKWTKELSRGWKEVRWGSSSS